MNIPGLSPTTPVDIDSIMRKSQTRVWGGAQLEATKGDSAVCSWFEKTMKDDPDETDKSMFTRLDRFVMELFRTISPHAGSDSLLSAIQQLFGTAHPGFSTMVTPHAETSRDPLNWKNPNEIRP